MEIGGAVRDTTFVLCVGPVVVEEHMLDAVNLQWQEVQAIDVLWTGHPACGRSTVTSVTEAWHVHHFDEADNVVD